MKTYCLDLCLTRSVFLTMLMTPGFVMGTSGADTWHTVATEQAADPHAGALLEGQIFTYPQEDLPVSDRLPKTATERTIFFGVPLVFAYTGLQPAAAYRVKATFLSEQHGRIQQVRAGQEVLEDRLKLPDRDVVERAWVLPPASYADGALTLTVDAVAGPNAVVASLVIESTVATPLQAQPQPGADVAPPRLTPLPAAGSGPPPDSLNGTWSFHPAPREGFEQDAGTGWQPIEVPGEWVMQGFKVEPGTAAGYRRNFQLPDTWKGRRVKLRFDAVYSECTVWVNGHPVGEHLGGFTPFELDLSEVVKPGKNQLVLAVKNESLADQLASGTKYAAHPLGGIPRKVTLFSVPEVHVALLHVSTRLDEAYRDAVAQVEVEIANESGTGAEARLRAAIVRPETGEVAAEAEWALAGSALEAGRVAERTLELPVAAPALWDCEHPNLYRLRVELSVAGKVVEHVERRFGFVQTEVRENRLFVNGRPVKLRGINRHEAHPTRGRSLPEGLWRRDVELFRNANVNLIRTSHYPPAEELMEAADELGMFIEAEAPFCWANGQGYPPDQVMEATVRQTLELVQRDRSHPSVLFWSLANESGWNRYFVAASRAARALDPTRPQTFEYGGKNIRSPGGSPEAPFCEIGSSHYPGPRAAVDYAGFARPVNFGEYCHLNAYNRFELVTDPGLRDAWGRGTLAMWENLWKEPAVLGASFWAGIDDSFFLPDGKVVGYGTWGPIDGWRRPKPEYAHVKKTYSPVRVTTREVTVDPANTISVPLENRFFFTDLSELSVYGAVVDPGVRPEKAQLHPLQVTLAAGARGILEVPLPVRPSPGSTLYLRFDSPLGFTVEETRLALRGFHALETEPQNASMPWKLADTPEGWRIERGNVRVGVSRRDGQLSGPGLAGGPHLMLLPLNNQGGTQMTGANQQFAPYTETCQDWQCSGVEALRQDEDVILRVHGGYREAKGTYTLHFQPSGEVTAGYAFTVQQAVNPRQVGLVFELPRACDTLTWERDGLWTIYPEDHPGRTRGTAPARAGQHEVGPAGPAEQPDWPWSHDGHALGSNDFRSSREDIRRATLTDPTGVGLDIRSGGSQHVRTWVHGDRVHLLIADYMNAGAERFFRRHAVLEDRPLKPGDVVEGTIQVNFTTPARRSS